MNGRAGPAPGEALGWLAALAATVIWSGFAVATRGSFLSTTERLMAVDLVALRFLFAGLVMLPRALLRPPPLRRLPAWRVLCLVTTGGFTFSLCNTSGFAFAPAAHGAALTSPLGAVFTGTLAAFVLGERLTRGRLVGLGVIVVGACALLAAVATGPSPSAVFIGHALFLAAALQWAVYVVVLRGSRLAPLDALALTSVGAAVLYLPAWLVLRGPGGLLAVSPATLILQGTIHGLLSQTVSLMLFIVAVSRLGAARPALCGALVPPMVAAGAALLLAEPPPWAELPGLALLTLGVGLAALGPQPRTPAPGVAAPSPANASLAKPPPGS